MSTAAVAAPCDNYAKQGAIRAYKSQGAVQGSEGIEYSAKLVKSANSVYDYLVSISDNNDEGESWTVDYLVRVEKDGNACHILKVTELEN